MRYSTRTMLILASLAVAAAPAPAGPATAPAESPEWFRPVIRAVAAAPDLPAVQAAYARGRMIDPNNAELMGAYVRRLVDIGHPEVAYETAERLVAVDPNNALAWAVLAYMRAELGRWAEALPAGLKAAELAGDDPFVLAVAATLIARYDHHGRGWQIDDDLKRRLEKVKADLMKNETFASAYAEARAALERASEPPPEAAAPAADAIEGVDYADKYVYITGRGDSIDVEVDYGPRYTSYYPYRYFSYFGPYYYPFYRHYGVIVVGRPARGKHRGRDRPHHDRPTGHRPPDVSGGAPRPRAVGRPPALPPRDTAPPRRPVRRGDTASGIRLSGTSGPAASIRRSIFGGAPSRAAGPRPSLGVRTLSGLQSRGRTLSDLQSRGRTLSGLQSRGRTLSGLQSRGRTLSGLQSRGRTLSGLRQSTGISTSRARGRSGARPGGRSGGRSGGRAPGRR